MAAKQASYEALVVASGTAVLAAVAAASKEVDAAAAVKGKKDKAEDTKAARILAKSKPVRHRDRGAAARLRVVLAAPVSLAYSARQRVVIAVYQGPFPPARRSSRRLAAAARAPGAPTQ